MDVLEPVIITMSQDDANLFVQFQKRYQTIAHLLGCMDTLRINELKNASITMDIDMNGRVTHTAITSHYR